MAKIVVTGAYFALNLGGGLTTYHEQVSECTLDLNADKVETTNFASGGWEESITGIKRGTLNATLIKDADLSGLDSGLWDRFSDGADVAFEIRTTQSAVSTTNPKATGNVKIPNYMLGGALNSALGGTLSLPTTGAVTRGTS